jgi:membrane fusion protein, copper/silver efflux system
MNKQIIIAFCLALVIGGGGGYWYARNVSNEHTAAAPTNSAQERKPVFYRNPMNPEITSPVPAKDSMGMDYVPVYADVDAPQETERKVLFYRNPMNPDVTSPVPAKDSMGMDYVPVYADAGSGSGEPAGTVKIDPVTEQNIGVRTAKVVQQSLSHTIRTIGRVDYDEERMVRLHPKVEGWIEELFIEKTGEQVEEDTMLLSIYSPQLVTSQQEYLLALNNLQTLAASKQEDIRRGAEQMVKTSRERLELLDVPEHQIRELEESRETRKTLHIHSPFRGIALNIGMREGQYVTPKTELFMLADLSRVWVYADIYEDDLPWVEEGDEVTMELNGIPGRIFTGQLTYVYPYAEARTRTIKVRLEFDNPDLLLKPEMYANVTIHARSQQDAVVIPSEAVVRSGMREQVFVVRGPGKFEPREVKLGVSSEGLVQVLEGVEPDEVVVTSSQFLIDSESKLREATAKMLESAATTQQTGEQTPEEMNHGEMDMEMDHGEMDMEMDHGEMNMKMDMDQEEMDHD